MEIAYANTAQLGAGKTCPRHLHAADLPNIHCQHPSALIGPHVLRCALYDWSWLLRCVVVSDLSHSTYVNVTLVSCMVIPWPVLHPAQVPSIDTNLVFLYDAPILWKNIRE